MKFEDKVKWLREKKYKGRETEEFLHDVKRVANGEAVEYLVGQVDFCGAKIDLSLHPMIPRPETEHWVRGVIEEIKKCESAYTIRVLDLFSGSGCVGLAILKNIPETYVDMIELDPKLKEQIEISVDRNVIRRTRARVVTGDTWEGASSRYDYITAVPPYVPPSMKEEVMKELHQEEPLSFFDKEDGYFYHKQVLSCAKEFLKEGGVAYLEFDTTQRTEIESLAQGYGWENYSFLKDPYGNECVIRLPTGYRGTIINVKAPNGLISEVQIVEPKILYGKDEGMARAILGDAQMAKIEKEVGVKPGLGHSIYEKIRKLSIEDKESEIGRKLLKQSVDYYNKLK